MTQYTSLPILKSLITVMSLIVCSSSAVANTSGETITTVPLSNSHDGLFTLDVQLNGDNTSTMILDTAADVSSVKNETVNRLQLETTDDTWRIHGLLSVDSSRAVNLDSVQVQNINYSGPFLVLKNDTSIKDAAVSGLLGVDFLSSTANDSRYMILDLNLGQLSFTSDLRQAGLSNSLRWSSLIDFGDQSNILAFKSKVSGIDVVSIIDTGISFGVINQPFADRLAKKGREIHSVTYKDVNGEDDTLRHLQLGKLVGAERIWEGYGVVVFDAPALHALGLGDIPSMLMGLAFFRDQIIVIDRKKDRISIGDEDTMRTGKQFCTGSRVNCSSLVKNRTVQFR